MLSRRKFVWCTAAAAAGLAACRRKASGYAGFAFVANQEGQAVAALDLESFTVARHIHLDGRPSQVVANAATGRVYALTPENGTIHEIRTETLTFRRKLRVSQTAIALRLSNDGQTLFAISDEPRQMIAIAAESLRVISETP